MALKDVISAGAVEISVIHEGSSGRPEVCVVRLIDHSENAGSGDWERKGDPLAPIRGAKQVFTIARNAQFGEFPWSGSNTCSDHREVVPQDHPNVGAIPVR